MKALICRVILFFLYRGMRVLEVYDPVLRQELLALPQGLTFGIRTSPHPGAPSIVLVNGAKGLRKGKAWEMPHILITFKSLSLAVRVLIGLDSIADAYAQHSFTLQGNINAAMGFVRAMEITEGYLFPSFWAKRILKRLPKKRIPTLGVYVFALLGL